MAVPGPGPAFPGRTIIRGERDRGLVRAIQARLNARGCGPIGVDGVFGADTENAVRLFQARFPDAHGHPLAVDGQVGLLTWGALFGPDSLPPAAPQPVSALAGAALGVAISQLGVMEDPPGSNRGPQVDAYLEAAGIDPATDSYAWCAAFVYWCFQSAAGAAGLDNPAIRTAGVLDAWLKAGRAGLPRVLAADAQADPSLVRPGHVFALASGGGLGHMGLVEKADGGLLATVEGNTNDNGYREGVGVFRRTRKLIEINRGFIAYG